MLARLVARTGPLQGAEFPLGNAEFTIGRDEANALCLPDPKASRWHCAIGGDDRRFTIRDLDSRNGTYVNDVKVHEHPLAHGDEIRIGQCVFEFLVEGELAGSRAFAVDFDEGERVGGSATRLRKGDPLYLSSETLLDTVLNAPAGDVGTESRADAPVPSPRQARPQPADPVTDVVRAIVRACKAITSGLRLEQLQQGLLESIFECIRATRGAILVVSGNGSEFASAVHWVRFRGRVKSFRIPRVVIQSVLTDRTALCLNDLLSSGSAGASETIVQAQVSSIMAAPVVAGELLVGAMYVDAADPLVRFDERDLQLLTAIADVSAAALASALKIEQLERDNERLVATLHSDRPLVGAGERIRAVHQFVAKVAPSDSTVLIAGESGTGKELVARAIHRQSTRARMPFVAVSCAAVPEHLLESEFFGYEKGAFTGAASQRKGKLEEADGGTIFLDEIGELALPLQSKLLRVLQEREFERVGGTRTVRVNIRVIAATNRNLDQEVRRGTFRQDLYYRLNVVSVTTPPLRDRREDIPLLANFLLHRHAKKGGRRISGFSAEALSCLTAYEWPGNVRELENVVERAVVLGTTAEILPDDLPDSIVESGEAPAGADAKFHDTIREIKKQLVVKALEDAGGSHVMAAKRLGLHPNNLHRLMKTLNLKPSR
jgi:transcriptional regulator with GAF, ATPase, and Fis domain